jgi:alkylated DNA repair dioxygenase AlkB
MIDEETRRLDAQIRVAEQTVWNAQRNLDRLRGEKRELEERSRPVCQGYRWIGQSLRYCDRCGHPYWEHDHEERLDRTKQFSITATVWEYVLLTERQKLLVKLKWGNHAESEEAERQLAQLEKSA